MRRLFPLLFILSVLLTSPVYAQETPKIPVNDVGVSYLFGEQITFKARLSLPVPASEVYILFRANGENVTRVFPISVEPDGLSTFTYAFEQGPVRPFATVHFSYLVKLQDGQELSSEDFFFVYEDNRFPWQKVEADKLRVHWYAGDQTFGQAALDAATRGLARSRELLLIEPASPIDVYIYASATDLQKALEIGGLPWAGGHASPDLRLSLVSIPPGPEQGLDMDRKIPHELAHILTYDLTRERYERLPVWLREGIASRAELSTNPDYPRAVSIASGNQSLIPFSELCGSFPLDGGRAFLAYAQSEAFTRFIIEKYGQSGLIMLIQAYGDGLDCEQGPVRAFGRPLSLLEAEWRTDVLGQSPVSAALRNLFPYLVILAAILIVPLVNAFLFKRVSND